MLMVKRWIFRIFSILVALAGLGFVLLKSTAIDKASEASAVAEPIQNEVNAGDQAEVDSPVLTSDSKQSPEQFFSSSKSARHAVTSEDLVEFLQLPEMRSPPVPVTGKTQNQSSPEPKK